MPASSLRRPVERASNGQRTSKQIGWGPLAMGGRRSPGARVASAATKDRPQWPDLLARQRRRIRAESALTRVVSGRTGLRPKADTLLRARTRLSSPSSGHFVRILSGNQSGSKVTVFLSQLRVHTTSRAPFKPSEMRRRRIARSVLRTERHGRIRPPLRPSDHRVAAKRPSCSWRKISVHSSRVDRP